MGKRPIPDLRRRKAHSEPKRRFFIFCEGKNTEPAYFDAIRRRFCGTVIMLEVTKAAGVPSTIADKAIAKAKELRKPGRSTLEKNDQVWAVFDRDEHPKYNESVQACENNRVGVGRSNPCFELWLILHDRDYDRPDDRHAIQQDLSECYPDYDRKRGKMLDCARLMETIEQAEARAEKLLTRCNQDGFPFHPPYTTVGRLTREIRKAALAFSHQGLCP